MKHAEFKVGKAKLCLVQEDITEIDTDAIVNAANPTPSGPKGTFTSIMQ